jgi:hypothetical protein
MAQLLAPKGIKNFSLGGVLPSELLHRRGRFLTPLSPRLRQLRCHKISLLRPPRYSPHTSASRPRTCAQGRFRGVDATHVPAAGPGSQPRRLHFRRSPEAVHGPNHLRRQPISGFPRRRGGRLYGKSQIQSFAFPFPASSACARSLLVPGTCDLTRRRTDASDSAAPCTWNDPISPAP